jgi:carbamoyltransferase
MLRQSALGVHIGHDRSAALVSDGELVAHIAEERLDRRRHSNSPKLPLKSIRAVLRTAGLQASDLGVVGISYTNVEIQRVVEQIGDELRDELRTPNLPIVGVGHHDCHAWSTYYTSDLSSALVVVADGSGDIVGQRIEAESVYTATGGRIDLIGRRLQDFGLTRTDRRNSFLLPYMNDVDRGKSISLGRKYEQFTYLIGFQHDESGKTMGLAAYGSPLFRPTIPPIDDLHFPLTFDDGLLEVDRIWQASGEPWHHFAQRHAAEIAATAQEMLEGYMIALLKALNPKGVHKSLCGAGGVFLNCQMNYRILTDANFNHLHVVPAAGDDGQSIGAAFFAYAQSFASPRRTSSMLPYLGPPYVSAEIQERLTHFGLTAKRLDDSWLAERVAADLADGKIIGLLRGRSETGPRALCHRSILADPRREGMKNCLNYLKGRELFRPFAPAVTAEDQFKYFELEQASPFMLLATRLRPEYRAALPAIVHADGTSRVQSVEREKEPFIHSLLKAFERAAGHPLLLNTSFNLAGEPIVEAPHDAIVTFLSSDIDVLVIDNFYVDKKSAPRLPFRKRV